MDEHSGFIEDLRRQTTDGKNFDHTCDLYNFDSGKSQKELHVGSIQATVIQKGKQK